MSCRDTAEMNEIGKLLYGLGESKLQTHFARSLRLYFVLIKSASLPSNLKIISLVSFLSLKENLLKLTFKIFKGFSKCS